MIDKLLMRWPQKWLSDWRNVFVDIFEFININSYVLTPCRVLEGERGSNFKKNWNRNRVFILFPLTGIDHFIMNSQESCFRTPENRLNYFFREFPVDSILFVGLEWIFFVAKQNTISIYFTGKLFMPHGKFYGKLQPPCANLMFFRKNFSVFLHQNTPYTCDCKNKYPWCTSCEKCSPRRPLVPRFWIHGQTDTKSEFCDLEIPTNDISICLFELMEDFKISLKRLFLKSVNYENLRHGCEWEGGKSSYRWVDMAVEKGAWGSFESILLAQLGSTKEITKIWRFFS